MNKKINYLAIIPIFGTIFLLFLLFVKTARGKINKKIFHTYFISSSLFGFLAILTIILLLNFVNSIINITNFMSSYGILVAFIVGGYLMNLFAFTLINKKWNDLEKL